MSARKSSVNFTVGKFYENVYNAGWQLLVKKVTKNADGSYDLLGDWYEAGKGSRKNLNIEQTVVVTKEAERNWSLKS